MRNFTSGAQYPEINWFPGIVTLKSIDFWVLIPGNVPNIFEEIYRFLPRFQGIFTKVVFLTNVLVSLPEINWFPSHDTRKSIYFLGSWPGNRYKKNLILWIYPWRQKYFSMWIQGPGTYYWLMKKTRGQKSHATVPLKNPFPPHTTAWYCWSMVITLTLSLLNNAG